VSEPPEVVVKFAMRELRVVRWARSAIAAHHPTHVDLTSLAGESGNEGGCEFPRRMGRLGTQWSNMYQVNVIVNVVINHYHSVPPSKPSLLWAIIKGLAVTTVELLLSD
jgi:hypothetical protein